VANKKASLAVEFINVSGHELPEVVALLFNLLWSKYFMATALLI